VSFGNFLIKQVVEELSRELPSLATFVTLSPVPGFAAWLAKCGNAPSLAPGWHSDPELAERARAQLLPLAAEYFLAAKGPGGKPVDPVARFHLGNGARLERLNWLGDTSAKGLREAHGLMVNYLYDLRFIEANHEAFANDGRVVASAAVRRHLPATQPAPERVG
jgi:malonyl-CoA decarboxylase